MFAEISYRSKKDDTPEAGAEHCTGVGTELGLKKTEMIADYSFVLFCSGRCFNTFQLKKNHIS